MKGTVVRCMQELVTTKFGESEWKASLRQSGIPENRYFGLSDDIPDEEAMRILQGIADAASLSVDQAMEAFGEYWSSVYAPDIYGVYFAKSKSTRELLLNLDEIHVAMTRTMKAAQPPRFTYEWKNDKVLVMKYESKRGLVALMPGLIRGLGKYYKDDPKVSSNGNMIEVQFR